MASGIYKITIADLFYIGSSICLSNRFEKHIEALRNSRHHNIVLQRAFNKHRHIKISTLFYCDKNVTRIEEQKLIDIYIDHPRCANVSRSAFQPTLTPEQRAKVTELNRHRICSAETRAKLSASGKGRKMSQSHREMLTELNRVRSYTQETRNKMSKSAKIRSKGSGNTNARLTESQAIEILESKGLITAIKLADKYQIAQVTVNKIWQGKIWKHINQAV